MAPQESVRAGQDPEQPRWASLIFTSERWQPYSSSSSRLSTVTCNGSPSSCAATRCGGSTLREIKSVLSAPDRCKYGASLRGSGSLRVLFLACHRFWRRGIGHPTHRSVCERVFLRLAHLRGRHCHLPQPHLVGVLVLWQHRGAAGGAGGWCRVAEEEQGRSACDQRRGHPPLRPLVERHQELIPQGRKTHRRPRESCAEVNCGATGVPGERTGRGCLSNGDPAGRRRLSSGR